jgi:hypothetical protein
LTPGNTDDRKFVPEMTQEITGKMFGDKGDISEALVEKLFVKRRITTDYTCQEEHATKINTTIGSNNLTKKVYY